jgi:hypothetical protein
MAFFQMPMHQATQGGKILVDLEIVDQIKQDKNSQQAKGRN